MAFNIDNDNLQNPAENSAEETRNSAEDTAQAVASAATPAPSDEPQPAGDAAAPVEPSLAAVAEGSAAPAEPADAAAVAAATSEEEAISAEAMDKLIDEYSKPAQASAEGEIVEATVVEISDHGVHVSVGGKSEYLIPASEFADNENAPKFEAGNVIEVQVTSERDKNGSVLVSYQRAHRRRVWQKIEKSYRNQETITARVIDRIKGGLVVDVGVRAFLPASQADVRPVRDLEAWKDREVPVRVLKMNRKRGNVVVSHRVLQEEELKAQREKLLESLTEGAVLTGKVKNLTDYGAFIDLGGMDGLLHVTDLSWGRITKPGEMLSPGQEIEVQVLKFDKEKNRISLGRKQLLPDPWQGLPERYPVGAKITGKVAGVTDYGAFVELEPGVEGLVHVSEMSWSKRAKHPSKIVSQGDAVEVVVLGVNPEARRISLGMKQSTPDPWQAMAEKYPVGTKVSGRVRNMTDFGAFVEIEEGFDGLIHVSDIRWGERVKHPSEVFKKGDTVEAKVLKIDHENRRLSLGVKQLNDIWENWFAAHKVNQVVRGKVSRNTTFGSFVELAEGIEGLCHISEIEDRRRDKDKEHGRGPGSAPAGKKSGNTLEVGQEYDFKIVKVSPEAHKIGLSYKAAIKQAERKEIQEYRSTKSSATATIGDAVMAKRNAG